MKKNIALRDFFRTLSFGGWRLLPFFVGILGHTIGWSFITVVSAYVSKDIIDAATTGRFELFKSGLYLGLIYVPITIIVSQLFGYMCCEQGRIILANARKKVMVHRSNLPVSYFEINHSGDFISRLLYDTDHMCEIFTSRLRRFIAPIISCIIYLVPMFLLSWRITLILVAVNTISLIINTKFAVPINKLSSQISKLASVMTEKLINILAGISIVKTSDAVSIATKKFADASEEYTQKSIKLSKISSTLGSINFAFELLSGFAFLIIGAAMVTAGWVTFGALVGLASLQKSLSWQFLQVGKYIPEIFDCLASASRIFEFLDTPVEPESYDMPELTAKTYVEMQDVSFSYNDDRSILKNFSMSVEKGKRTAVIGSSGAGKSTIVKLLLGFYPPNSGSIIIDGKTLAQRTLKETRSMISYVPQEPYIYNDTIANNILFGKPNATQAEVEMAAIAANAQDFILEQPQGYKTIAGERGTRLSGGQRQRIAIARAILKDAPILILDEATSALDNESEQLVQQAIERLVKDRTTIIIAHRPSTIASADAVIKIGE